MRKLSRILPVLATMVLLLGLVSVADAQGRLPHPPVNVQASVTDEQLTLTWQVNVSNSQVTGYRIERYEGHRSGWETLEDSLLAANQFPWDNPDVLETYVDTGVLPSAPYRYRIRSVNDRGISSRYAGVEVETAVDPPVLRIFTDHGRVIIGWDTPEDDSVTGYRILRRVQGARGNAGGRTPDGASPAGSTGVCPRTRPMPTGSRSCATDGPAPGPATSSR